MNKLSKEEVLHVANLAALEIKEEETEQYGVQLFDILSEIEKITQLELDPFGDILIAPIHHTNMVHEDSVEPMLTKEEIMHNVPCKTETYVVVPEVFHDELFES